MQCYSQLGADCVCVCVAVFVWHRKWRREDVSKRYTCRRQPIAERAQLVRWGEQAERGERNISSTVTNPDDVRVFEIFCEDSCKTWVEIGEEFGLNARFREIFCWKFV